MSTPVPPIIDQEEQTRRALQERQLREQQEKIQGLLSGSALAPLQTAQTAESSLNQDLQDPILRGAIREREHAAKQEAFRNRSIANIQNIQDNPVGDSRVKGWWSALDPSQHAHQERERWMANADRATEAEYQRGANVAFAREQARARSGQESQYPPGHYMNPVKNDGTHDFSRAGTAQNPVKRDGKHDFSRRPTNPDGTPKTIPEVGDNAQTAQSTGNPSETINQNPGSGTGGGKGPPTADGSASWQAEFERGANETVDRVSRRAIEQIEKPDLSPATPEENLEALRTYREEALKLHPGVARQKVDQLLTKMESIMNSPAIPEDKRSKMAKVFLEVIPLAILAGLGRMDVVQMILGMKQQKVQDALAARKQKLGELGVLAGAYDDKATREESERNALVQSMIDQHWRDQRDAKGNKLDLYEAQLTSADRNRGYDIDERGVVAAERRSDLMERGLQADERAMAEQRQQQKIAEVENAVMREMLYGEDTRDLRPGTNEYQREFLKRRDDKMKYIDLNTYGQPQQAAPALPAWIPQ